MSYDASVFKVMIASPGDVNAERGIVREMLGEWNAIHSEKSKAVLLPIGWETHASPGMGESAQSIINKTVLKDCDLLVGIFWTRVGTATEDYDSGTVEEIERHIAEHKPTMLYFSSAPVMPESVDAEQYLRLKNFRDSCKSRGLLESYSSLQDFRSAFSRHIQLKINQDPYFDSLNRSSLQQALPERSAISLSKEAGELLHSAASVDGQIMNIKTLGGQRLQAGLRSFIEGNNPRSIATWEAALKELEDIGYIQALGYKREMFKTTHQGYNFYDSHLKGQS